MTDAPELDQPGYYESKFTGEWKFQKENRIMRYQLLLFTSVLLISLAVLIGLGMMGINRNSPLLLWFGPIIGLDLLFFFMEYDV
jgi:hypothetical protein